jgi:hypothetical protein
LDTLRKHEHVYLKGLGPVITDDVREKWHYFYSKFNFYNSTLNYCYAMTVHKSQGSQYNTVVCDAKDINISRAGPIGKKLLYTAVSRMVNEVYISLEEPYGTCSSYTTPEFEQDNDNLYNYEKEDIKEYFENRHKVANETQCNECFGSTRTYWSDDVYGPCMSCACINCGYLSHSGECKAPDKPVNSDF